MGAGSAKGVRINDEDFDIENDRFSVISHDSPEINAKGERPGANNNNNNNNASDKKSKVRVKIEALYDESDEEEGSGVTPTKPAVTSEREDEKKRGLFGFSRRREEDDKTNVFVHESDNEGAKKGGKRDGSKGFKLFSFRKDGRKSEEKDEPLDQEINDLQKTFDSLGIVGQAHGTQKTHNGTAARKSQSADDIRDLEPMRNRMNQKRRFSRPSNMTAAGPALRRTGDGLNTSSGGSKRTFKYSWEVNDHNGCSSPSKSEEWKYEAVSNANLSLIETSSSWLITIKIC